MDGNTAAVGRHWQTQLAIAVAFLKQHNAPIRLEDLAIRSGVEHLLTNPELQQGLRQHERVRFDERTQLVSYKVRSRGPLLSMKATFAFTRRAPSCSPTLSSTRNPT